MTCSESASNCILTCEQGCTKCNGLAECDTADPGYYIDPITKRVQCKSIIIYINLLKYLTFLFILECDHNKCAKCSDFTTCLPGEECPVGCQTCDVNKVCQKAKDGKYLDGSNNPQDCDPLCKTCFDAGPTKCKEPKDGYYFENPITRTPVTCNYKF